MRRWSIFISLLLLLFIIGLLFPHWGVAQDAKVEFRTNAVRPVPPPTGHKVTITLTFARLQYDRATSPPTFKKNLPAVAGGNNSSPPLTKTTHLGIKYIQVGNCIEALKKLYFR